VAGPNWQHQHPRDIGVIVEEQVRRWQLNLQPVRKDSPVVWPVVTISREFGTSGLALGRRVAHRLGFTCWDREIVAEIARRLGTDQESVNVFDEHAHAAIDDLVGVLLHQETVSADYGEQLRLIVRSIARRGGAVIAGRGSQFIVDDHHALRVRLVAPFELRVREVGMRTHVSPEEASRRVRAGDRDREQFLRQYFGQDGSNPTDYDVVINAGVYSPQRADALVLMAYLAKFGQIPPTAGETDEESEGPISRPPEELPTG